MAILITGSTGFVGQNLVSRLKKEGLDLVLFSGDILKKENFKNSVKGKKIEAVIHLAAKISSKNKKEMEEINVSGTKNAIDFCQEQGIRRLIFLSTARVLSGASNPYIDSKRRAEKLIEDSGLGYVIIRPSLVYGKGDKKNIGSIINMAKKMPLVPIFDFKMRPVYISDLIEVIFSCLNMPLEKEKINIIGNEKISYAELINVLKRNGLLIKIINLPQVFNFFLKTCSLLPFFPLPRWQVDALLSDEDCSDFSWAERFKIKPVSIDWGIKNILED